MTALAAAESACNEGKAETDTKETPVRQTAWSVRAMLLARIYEVFPLICPKCGGTTKITAFVDQGVALREILAHLGEPVVPPCIALTHGRPLWEAPGSGSDDLLIQPLPEYEFDQRIAW